MRDAQRSEVMTAWKLLVLIMVLSAPALAQTAQVQAKSITDADVQLLRQDLQTQKTQIITDTMNFTESEAATFWPVYKEYASEQQAIAAKRLNLIIEYSQNLDKLNDAKARDLSQRLFAVEDDTQALRKKYYPRFEQALGAKRAAKFYQVDNRLTLIINFQLASEIPLIP
jgi:hypothetical protein